jgi:hypothetical protein
MADRADVAEVRRSQPGALPAWVFPAIAAGLVAAAIGGLWDEGTYNDPRAVAEMLRGYDFVNLFVVVPAILLAAFPPWRASVRAHLVRAGMLVYVVYTYAYYLFGTKPNDVFLIHVALFSGSLFALVVMLARSDVSRIAGAFHPRTPRRFVSGVLAVLGTSLAGIWIAGAIRFAVTGEMPEEPSRLVVPAAVTHLGAVMDLSLLIPSYLLAAVLLWRRNRWGYVLAPVLLFSGSVHQVSYMVAMIFQARAGIPGATALDPAEPIILAAYLLAAMLLLRGAGSSGATERLVVRA